MFDVALERSQVEITLRRFLVNLGGILLKAVVIISVASMVGVETTSFIAMLGAAGPMAFVLGIDTIRLRI